jgi:hypothetical protein
METENPTPEMQDLFLKKINLKPPKERKVHKLNPIAKDGIKCDYLSCKQKGWALIHSKSFCKHHYKLLSELLNELKPFGIRLR